ncbi:MAG: TatD family deoxyribonuclease [Clostridiales bacterium]|nr:TatD family deoxyribonuclease [Clostridiales bacterium]
MIDTHAHLQDEKFEDYNQIIYNAQKVGVNKIVCASSSIKTSILAVKIANEHQNIFATVGVHPEEAEEWNEQARQNLIKLAKSKKVVAIGEIGLDYYYEFCTRQQQKKAFIEQIKLANELSLPVVIHTRDASGDTIQILRENLKYLTNGVVIHCYSMSLEILKEIIDYGFYISLGGAITFKNARGLLDIVKECPLNRLMLETDCPYMSPEPFRGKRNEPKNVVFVAEKIAELKNMSLAQVQKITTANAEQFFKI